MPNLFAITEVLPPPTPFSGAALDVSRLVLPIPLELLAAKRDEGLLPMIGARDAYATGRCLIDAQDDFDAIRVWLREKTSKSTLRAYTKQIERFFWWLILLRGRTLATATRDDAQAYDAFLQAPPDEWCALRHHRRDSEEWRMFEGPLDTRSRTFSLIVISACFEFLRAMNYVTANPINAKRNKKDIAEQLSQSGKRVIPLHALKPLLATLTKFADDLHAAPRVYRSAAERRLFVMRFLANTGLRREELARASMSDIDRTVHASTGTERFFLQVTGKGDVPRDVALNQAAIAALRRYMASADMPMQFINNPAPLVMPISGRKGEMRHLTDQLIYRCITEGISKAQPEIAKTDPDAAHALEGATPHYLRHTFGTVMHELGMDAKLIQAQLGHESIDTTMSIYVNVDRERLFDSLGGLNL